MSELLQIRVGELARRSGLSVRALHHYDQIGLLSPSRRSAAGHRLYSEADVVRLLRICTLQQTGMSLEEIGRCLDDAEYSPVRVLELRLAQLRDELDRGHRLCRRLEVLLARLRDHGSASTGDLLQTIEEMTMFEKYYTPDQLDQLERRRRAIGEDRVREVEAAWPALIAEVRAEMATGTDPAEPRVQALAARWQALVDEFTGGDAGIERAVGRLYREEPGAGERFGLDAEVMAYVDRAHRAL